MAQRDPFKKTCSGRTPRISAVPGAIPVWRAAGWWAAGAYALRSDDPTLLERVWEDFYLRGQPDVRHFTTMLAAYDRAGDGTRALLTYRRMRERAN